MYIYKKKASQQYNFFLFIKIRLLLKLNKDRILKSKQCVKWIPINKRRIKKEKLNHIELLSTPQRSDGDNDGDDETSVETYMPDPLFSVC